MSLKPLTYEKYSQLKERKELLERLIKSYTIWDITDPPEKSPEEIESLKNLWREEAACLDPILKRYKNEMIGYAFLSADNPED